MTRIGKCHGTNRLKLENRIIIDKISSIIGTSLVIICIIIIMYSKLIMQIL